MSSVEKTKNIFWKGGVIEPQEAKRDVGFLKSEKPYAEHFNYLFASLHEAFKHSQSGYFDRIVGNAAELDDESATHVVDDFYTGLIDKSSVFFLRGSHVVGLDIDLSLNQGSLICQKGAELDLTSGSITLSGSNVEFNVWVSDESKFHYGSNFGFLNGRFVGFRAYVTSFDADSLTASNLTVTSGHVNALTSNGLSVVGVSSFDGDVSVFEGSKLGVGTDTPRFPLSIQSSGESYSLGSSSFYDYSPSGTLLDMYSTSPNSCALIHFHVKDGLLNNGSFFGAVPGSGANNGAHLVFGQRTGGTSWKECLRIQSQTGYLGIGTNNPLYPLDVNGDAYIHGDLHIQGGFYFESATEITKDQITVSDNILTLNKSDDGGRTAIESGLEIFRHDGSTLDLIANTDEGVLRLGTTGNMQPLATRKELVSDQSVAFWDGVGSQYDNDSSFKYDSITHTLTANTIDFTSLGSNAIDVVRRASSPVPVGGVYSHASKYVKSQDKGGIVLLEGLSEAELNVDILHDNYMFCQGQWVSQVDYPELYAILLDTYGVDFANATFQLPDYRGEFMRGVDMGVENDPDVSFRLGGGSVGSTQESSNLSHTHQFQQGFSNSSHIGSGGGVNGIFMKERNSSSHSMLSNTITYYGNTDKGKLVNSGGNESRPRNVNVAFLIRVL